ncbi:MAG: class I SAM-dependent methyltransferase [Planctomycetota bacterium]
MPFAWDELAEHYHDEVITPFSDEVSFPLAADIERVRRARAVQTVVDFGCGCGEALEMVAGQVPLAAGIDLSEGMLQETRRRLSRSTRRDAAIDTAAGAARRLRKRVDALSDTSSAEAGNVWLGQIDLRRLGALAGRVDLALAINSICPRTARQAQVLFDNIAATVRPGGTLIAVFPSLDTMEHLFALHRRDGLDPSSIGQVHGQRGLFVDSTDEQQKYFRPAEIEQLFEGSGLQLVKLEKLHYPWPLIDASGWGNFPRDEEIWDWYAVGQCPQ